MGKTTKKYFHELTDDEFNDAIKNKIKYSNFLQPKWCELDDALNYNFGCSGLISRKMRNEDYCKKCDYYKR